MQFETLFGLCYLLGDPGHLEPEVADVNWALFECDESMRPKRPMPCVHESVLGMDPTGRE
jgi:hypothetical protein